MIKSYIKRLASGSCLFYRKLFISYNDESEFEACYSKLKREFMNILFGKIFNILLKFDIL